MSNIHAADIIYVIVDNGSYTHLSCQEWNESTAPSIVNQNEVFWWNMAVVQGKVEKSTTQLQFVLKDSNFASEVPLIILRDV